MKTAHDIEHYEKSQIEILIFKQQLTQQLNTLTLLLKKNVLRAQSENGTDGLRRLTTGEPIYALIVQFSKDVQVLADVEQTISVVEKNILTDTVAEIQWAQNYLLQHHLSSIWSGVRSVVGNAYLYCWIEKNDTGFCLLLPTVEVYKALWKSSLLQQANKNIYIQDSFMQTIGVNQKAIVKPSNTAINIDGLVLNLTVSTESTHNESRSSLWLILAMTLPLLGLAIAIAWMIYLTHHKQAKMTKQLLHGTQEIAHELRTPLSNVNLYIGLILNKGSAVEQQQYGEIITSEMERITRIIDNATALMRGNQPNQFEYGKPSDLLAQLQQQYRLSLAQSGCTLALQNTDSLSYFYPKYAVEHVLLNLLNNAKKYAPGQKVTLGLHYQNNILAVWVKNSIANHSASNTNEAHTRQPEGLGLGLLSCKRILKSLGGQFECNITKHERCYTAYFPLREQGNKCLT